MQKVVFFLPFLNPLLHYSNLLKVFNWPCTSQKTVRVKNCFSFKIKDWIILFELAAILKNKLRFLKLDSKTLLVCHCAITSTKWRNMKATPTLILWEDISKNYWERPSAKLFMTCNINLLKPVLAQIITWHSNKVFRNLNLVVL